MDQINIVSGETKVFEWNDQVNRNFLESFMNGYIAVKLKNPNWNLYGIVLSSDQGRTYNTTEGSVYIAADSGNMIGLSGVVKGSWIVREGGIWVDKGIQTISTIEVLFNGINIGAGAQVFANALENVAKFRTLVGGQNITISESEETITIATTEASGEANTGQNVGDSGIGIFKQKSGVTLQFKKITVGAGLSISEAGNVITISNISPEAGETNSGQSLGTGIPIYVGKNGVVLQFNSLKFGGSVTGSLLNNEITISSLAELNTISNIGLGANVYKEKVGTEFKLRTIRGDDNIIVNQLEDTIDLSFSGLTNLPPLFPGSGISGNSYNGSSDQTWNINFAGGGFASTVSRSDHNHTLDSLSNSAMTLKSLNDIVAWNGSNWTNIPYPSGEIVSGVNLGSGQYPVFVEKNGTELRYRRLKPGSGIEMSITDTNYVEISVSGLQPLISAGISPQFYAWDKTWKQVDYTQLSNLPSLVTQFSDLSDVPQYTSSDALKFIRINSTYDALEYATVNLSLYQLLIPEGASPQYYSWDKTWRQINYSELTGTPPAVDLTNYVTLNGDQVITGQKIYEGAYKLALRNSQANSGLIQFTSSNTSSNTAIFGFPNITATRTWILPDKDGTIALTDDRFIDYYPKPVGDGVIYNRSNRGLLISKLSSNQTKNGNRSLLTILTNGVGGAESVIEVSNNNFTVFSVFAGNLDTTATYVKNILSIAPVFATSPAPGMDSRIDLYSLNMNHVVKFRAKDYETSIDTNYTFPSDGTVGQILTTDGSGNLYWSTVSGGGSIGVFSNTVNGLVPAPNSAPSGSKFLRDDATWQTISSGIVTYLRLNAGAYRSGELTLQSIVNDGVTITEYNPGTFTIMHTDTSSVSDLNTSGFTLIKDITFDGYGHVKTISTRSLLPANPTSNSYLRDDGVWVNFSGGGGSGTVTSVSAGNGMSFSTISTSGAVTLGTPSSITQSTTNQVTANSHTHKLSFTANSVLATNSNGDVVPFGLGGHFQLLATFIHPENGATLTWVPTSEISKTFLSLTDTPSSFSGQAGKGVRVNSNANALEFYTIGSGGISYSFVQSIQLSESSVSLVNDTSTPGNNKYYGTNNIGSKGWFNLPEGSIASETDPFFTQWINASNIVPIFSSGQLSLQIYDQGILKYTTVSVNLDNRYYTESEIGQFFSGASSITGYNKTNWDTAFGWGNHINLYAPLSRSITINGTTQTLAADRTWNVGIVTSVVVGGGIVLGGTLTDPILSIQSLAGVASSIGTINVSGNKIGVDLGTTSTTAAAGNHTHTQLHDRSHSIASTIDHTANNWKIFYSNGLGQVVELALSTNKRLLISRGVDQIPEFVDLSTLDVFGVGVRGLVPAVDNDSESEETRYLRADGIWSVPSGSGTGMSNPMTAIGDMIYRSAVSASDRLPIGEIDQVLSVKNIGGNLVPAWTSLSSTFILNISGDVNVSGAQNDALLQTSAINGKTSSSGLTDTDELLINQSGLKKATSLQIKQYINPLTSKGDLVVGNDSGNMSRFAANATSTLKILSQQTSITSWINYDLPTIMGLAYGTANQLLKVNSTRTALEYFTPSNLTPGNGISGSSYNGQSAQTWNLNFLSSGGVNGTSNNPARSDHSHDSFSKLPNVSTGKILGRSTSLAAGEIQEITINTIGSQSSLQFIGTTISAKLQNELSPTLGATLNANSNNISLSGNIVPVVDGSTPLKDLGSSSAQWRDIYSKGKVYLGGGTTFYAGDINGSAYFNNANIGIITARQNIVLGLWKFELADLGNTMRLIHNNIIRFEFYNTGDMKFFAS